MKKTAFPKLTLSKETIRRLTAKELRAVNGGGKTNGCITQRPACNCTYTSNPPP